MVAVLGRIMVAERGYKKRTGVFATDLNTLGIDANELYPNYVFGFSENCRKPSADASIKLSARLESVDSTPPKDSSKMVSDAYRQFVCLDDTFKEKIEIFAVGDRGGAAPDIWKMNHDNQVEHVQDGRKPFSQNSIFDFRRF